MLSAAAAVIAMLLPFFVDVVGLLGSLGFWPLTVFLPIQMHIAQTGESSPVHTPHVAWVWSFIKAPLAVSSCPSGSMLLSVLHTSWHASCTGGDQSLLRNLHHAMQAAHLLEALCKL